MTKKLTSEQEIRNRKAMAMIVINEKKIVCRRMNLVFRTRLIQCFVQSVSFYGSETWIQMWIWRWIRVKVDK